MGRMLRRAHDLEEQSTPSEQLVDSLIDAIQNPRFLVLAETSE